MKKNAKKPASGSGISLLFRAPPSQGLGAGAPLGGVHPAAARALQLHQSGQWPAAEVEYRKVLQAEPANVPALTNLGALLCQQNRLDEGIVCLERALAAQPRQPDVLNNLGNACKALGRLEEALGYYDRVVALQPQHAAAHSNRSAVLLDLGRAQEALDSSERALRLKPDFPDALNNRGNALVALQRADEALASFDRALQVQPGHAMAHNSRGSALVKLGRREEAIACFETAVRLQPTYAGALANLGKVLTELGRAEEALPHLDRALTLKPEAAESHFNRGGALRELKRHEEALAAFDHAIALRPDFAEAHNSRGDVLAALKRHDEALAAFDEALRLDPVLAAACNNRGVVLRTLGRHDEALRDFDRAMVLKPDDHVARWNKSLLDLVLGRFEEGWALFEARWQIPEFQHEVRQFPQPLWLGREPLAGRRLLLWSEQGLGDAVQFCRYAVLAREQGARVTLEVPAPLVDLIRTLDEQVQVVPRGAGLPLFDLQCPLMSLPHAFGTRLDSVPLARAYLHADPARQEQWRQRLGPRSRPRLGLVWSGSTLHKNDRYRSIALQDMLPLLQEDFEFHSLHKEYREQDLALLESDRRIHRHEADLRDFADTAALVSCLDAVLCVDTSVAHVAAALGRPTFIFIPADHDYRWLMQREDTPWYQSVRLLRQATLGQWAPEIERAREVLRQALA